MHFFPKLKRKRLSHASRKFEQNTYLKAIKRLKKTIPNWDNLFDHTVSDEERLQQWIRLKVVGEPLVSQYAWAVPDDKSLNILEEFSPLVELGAGKGYWASLLQIQNIDVIAVDREVPTESEEPHTVIRKGNPKVLASQEMKGRNLFLCYPDDSNGMAQKCLEHFQGEVIIHVGELLVTGGGVCGPPQGSFGKSSSADFQISLAENFHCILCRKLDNNLPFSNDYISVWKRTTFVPGFTKELATEADEHGEVEEEVSSSSEDQEEEEEEEDLWKSIPAQEQLRVNVAAPCCQHLL